MAAAKSSFLDKVLGRIDRLDSQGLQTVVERLASERRFLETLFDTIEDGVVVADEQGRIIYLNRAAMQLLGVKAAEAEGQAVTRLLPELDWPALARMDRNGGERVVRHEFEIYYPRRRFLRLYASPLDGEAKGNSGMALILHDATEARQKTIEAIESERAQALTLLAASVAHEIGNPLNALHIHLQLIEREVAKLKSASSTVAAKRSLLPGRIGRGKLKSIQIEPGHRETVQKIDEYLGVAKGEVTRLDYIITQFLQALRPTPPKLTLASLNEVVRATLTLLGPEMQNRGLQVVERLARHLPSAPCDPAQIKQVLVNLIKNAMQAMTRGGTLTVSTGASQDGVWFSVADSGGGIPQEQINRIYEPFYTTKKKGSGLGLMIVQRIVRDHGGRIELDNQIGHGATFRIWLPLHERQPRLLEERAGPPPESPTA